MSSRCGLLGVMTLAVLPFVMGQGCFPVQPTETAPLTASAGANKVVAPAVPTTLYGAATGGQPPYTFTWTPVNGGSDVVSAALAVSLVGTTEYTLTVTDAAGQTASARVLVIVKDLDIDEHPPLVASAGADRVILPAGSVTLDGGASGGQPPYTFTWTPVDGLADPSIAQPTASPTTTTEYTLTVTDAGGQTGTDKVLVTVNSPQISPLVASAGVDKMVLSGASVILDGAASGGQPPYIFAWTPVAGLADPSIAQPTASPTVTTEYTLTVTDAAGQTATDKVLVTVDSPEISPLVASAGVDKLVLLGVSVILDGAASGGQPPYTFAWTPGAGLINASVAQPTASPTATTAYTLTVTDAGGQTATDNVLVTVGTAVTGPIWSSSQWTLAGSPYVVRGSFQIPEGIALTIDPGVDVRYDGDAQIYVRGALIANGSPTQEITFQGLDPSVKSGATFIKFEGANLSDSQLSYVVMKNAVRSIRVGEESEFTQKPKNSGTLTVAHAELAATEVRTDGYETGARLILTDSVLSSSSVFGEYPRSEPIDIINSTISRCQITSDAYNKGITLNGCTLSDTLCRFGCCDGNITVLNSVLTQCVFQDMWDSSYATGPLKLYRCDCTNVCIVVPGVIVDIADSSFRYDAAYSPVFGLASGWVAPESKLTFAVGSIEHTTITGDGQGPAIKATGSDIHGRPLAAELSISHCTIRENEIGVLLSAGIGNCSITDSSFGSNSRSAIDSRRSVDVLATNNYWGTTDPAQIALLIHDYFDDITLARVTFVPFASGPIPDAGPRP